MAESKAYLAGSWALEGDADVQMDGWTDGWKISPFYRTLSPKVATAQKVKWDRPTNRLTD